MKRFAVLVLAFLLILSVACGKPADSGTTPTETAGESASDKAKDTGDVIKIGVFEPFTGERAQGGEQTFEGIELAFEEKSEVLGKKIELVKVDNKSDTVEAANAASKLVNQDKVVAIIGSYGSALSLAAGDIVKTAKVPAVGCSPTNPAVTLDNPFYFRVCFIDPFQGTVMANFAKKELKAKTAAIIKDARNDYAIGLAKFFKDSFSSGGEIVAEADYNSGDKDFTAQLNAVKQKNPDVIFAPGDYGDSSLLIKQARDAGIEAPIMGGDTWESPDFLAIGGEALEKDVYFSSHFSAANPGNDVSKAFLEKYKAKFNKEANAFAALGYDAYMVIVDAIEKAGSAEPEAIRDQLAKTSGFIGSTGTITLDENGDAVKSAVINKVQGGKFIYLTTVEPE